MVGPDLADSILRARAVVARLGERDLMAWWDDNALTGAGSAVARRLFPRTAALSQLVIALEAASIRHHAAVPQPSRLSLFRLPAPLELAVRRRLLAIRRGEAPLPLDLTGLIAVRPGQLPADVLQAFAATGAADIGAITALAAVDGVIDVRPDQALDPQDLPAVERALRLLVAGYAASGRGRLAVPIIEAA